MNATKCPHSADGWCLNCVNGAFRTSGETTNRLREEADALRAEVEGLKREAKVAHDAASAAISLKETAEAQLATAREGALEEAARMLAIFSDTSARHHAESIRALKKTKGGGA